MNFKYIKCYIKNLLNYFKTIIKWLILATIIGTTGGFIGSLFHICVDYATELRLKNNGLIFLLPIGGLVITGMYRLFRSKGQIDTNLVIKSVRENNDIPLVMVPLIFVGTVITHLLGGSAGREGAALQLGGGIGYNFGKLFRLNEKDMRIIVMSGMSSVFAALFGTPLTGAIFSLEVVSVGVFHYAGLLPCIISSVTAFGISQMFDISPVRFSSVVFQTVSTIAVLKVVVFAIFCAAVSIIFCVSIKKCEYFSKKFIPNKYYRALVGSAVIVMMTLSVKTYDYNGTGMDVISSAILGTARPEAFIIKIIFTAITVSAGFKGGEIVPAFFVGATFGCVFGSLLGLDAGFSAAMGFVGLFCGVVNCPVASMLLSLEVFGSEGMLFFAIVCGVSYMMSGYSGLYKSQKIIYSKLNGEYINVNTK